MEAVFAVDKQMVAYADQAQIHQIQPHNLWKYLPVYPMICQFLC